MSTSLSRVRTTQAQSQAQKAQIQQACRNCLQPGHRIAVCTELCTACANPPCGVIPSQCPVYIATKAEEKNAPRRKGKDKKESKVVKVSDIPATAGKAQTCSYCEAVLPSKTKLFKHLEELHGIVSNSTVPIEKIVLLFGWINAVTASHGAAVDDDVWKKDGNLRADYIGEVENKAFEALVNAIGEVDEFTGLSFHPSIYVYLSIYLYIYISSFFLSCPCIPPFLSCLQLFCTDVIRNYLSLHSPNIGSHDGNSTLKGMTGSSSCAARASWILGQESSCHASCETICLTAKKLLGREVNDWIQAVNSKLEAHAESKLRIIARQSIPANTELNCEVFCSQRLYGELMKNQIDFYYILLPHKVEYQYI